MKLAKRNGSLQQNYFKTLTICVPLQRSYSNMFNHIHQLILKAVTFYEQLYLTIICFALASWNVKDSLSGLILGGKIKVN